MKLIAVKMVAKVNVAIDIYKRTGTQGLFKMLGRAS